MDGVLNLGQGRQGKLSQLVLPCTPCYSSSPALYCGGSGRFCGLGVGVLGTGFDIAVEELPVLRTGRGESKLPLLLGFEPGRGGNFFLGLGLGRVEIASLCCTTKLLSCLVTWKSQN